MINDRILKLRELMKQHQVDIYYIPTSDYHNSEYVGDYFQTRKFMSGFTGSAGVMIVTTDHAYLWSDGRYYIQAQDQIKGSEIIFMKQGEEGVETPFEFMRNQLPDNGVIAFDGRTVTTNMGKLLKQLTDFRGGKLLADVDFVGDIWNDRPALEVKPAFLLDVKYVGESVESKLAKARFKMQDANANYHILTSLDDIAYLLNIRGRDILSTPVILSYLVIGKDSCVFYCDERKLSDDIKGYLKDNGISIKGYDDVYTDVDDLRGTIWLDSEIVNYTLYEKVSKEMNVYEKENPTIMMKAIKNSVEIENLRIAHIKDGVAVTKFMYWLKNNITKMEIDEVLADRTLTAFREDQSEFIEPSFDTISAYNANAAMMHYHATEDNKDVLKPEGLLLVDSGGQYMNGTTDITRTFALGEVNPVWKRDFTLVLRGMSALSRAKFLFGCTGINLDILARQPLWNMGIDYRSGTGHGVGFTLGVHEGPHGIRWRKMFRKEDTPLYEGMVVTDEPGVYEEGSHGIRIENELIVQKDVQNEYGQFMSFETITFAPIDLDMINEEYLDEETKVWLNTYHEEVYKKISPYLTDEENTWLKKYTRAI